ASTYNYNQFFQTEMQTRRTFQYPPYVFLALLTVSHPNQVKVVQTTQKIVQLLRKHVNERTVILGPTPSPITRVKDRYRYQCMIKYKQEPELGNLIRKIIQQFDSDIRKDDLLIKVDMQPYQLM